jgi:hypothetical protein
MLSGASKTDVDCARFFGALTTRLQMASNVIAAAHSSISGVTMGGQRARTLATVIADLFYFLEEGVPLGGSIRVCLAIAPENEWLVIGVAADGDVNPVSSRSATDAMLAACEIVRFMGGSIQRGIHGDRLVFGLTFPPGFAQPAPL